MSNVSTGPRVVFKINGTKVAYASNFQYSINHQLQPIEVLDKLEVAEHAEVGYDVSFSCDTFIVAGKGPIALGIQPDLASILTQAELTAEAHDQIADKVIVRIVGVKLNGRSGNIGSRAVGTESLSFVGIIATEE